MTLDELAPWLFSRTTKGIRWGLGRTEEMLAGVGDPHRRFHSVLIGGTNGKGSVAALCEAALRAGGSERVGLYTSPHLVSLTERVRIAGRPVEAEVFASAAARLKPAIERTGASFFEATTAIAFLLLAEAEVEVAVVEVGLGGRLDSTNVLEPMVSVVTNVARDHTEYLGDTLAEIAREKAGIFRPEVPALVGEADPAVAGVLREAAAAVGAPFHLVGERASVHDVRTTLEGTTFQLDSRFWGDRSLRLHLPGAHQALNAATAAEALALLPDRWRPPWAAVEAGFAGARWPGRLQVERIRGVTWLFDIAHNEAGAAALAAALEVLAPPRPLVVVAGILADKDWMRMLPPLARHADALVLTTPASAPLERRWDPAAAAERCAGELGRAPRVIPELAAALQRAETLAPHGTVVVTGSVHTVGDALRFLAGAAGRAELV